MATTETPIRGEITVAREAVNPEMVQGRDGISMVGDSPTAHGSGHILPASGPIYLKSKRRGFMAAPFAKAEFINLSSAGVSAMWIREMLSDAAH
ncbi:hypothetical protein XA68_11912 [Ophiocordyceps unilateralis]|uniref:Uncharacterized protein n=1 Tax=Ophiocordyceps unilateralis TaxID=268505 RepID=A0A2A9PFU4_OPHUN|nr:hypothetical protein XA68_11912 [Ophiocordyceps unilateralis]